MLRGAYVSPAFSQQRKFRSFAFPAIFKIQRPRRGWGRDFVIWLKGHLCFIFQTCPTHTAQRVLGTCLCLRGEVPGVFVNICGSSWPRCRLCCADLSHGVVLLCTEHGDSARVGCQPSPESRDTLADVVWVCLRNLHGPPSKCRDFFP